MRLSRIDEVSKVVSLIEVEEDERTEKRKEQGNAINETVSTEVAGCLSVDRGGRLGCLN